MNGLFRWLACAPASLVMNTLTFIFAPMLSALSVAMGRDVLPGPLAWFHTFDNTLDGGQRDLGWPPSTGFRLWWQRTRWMWRNPASAFDTKALGIPKGHVVTTDLRSALYRPGFLHRGYIATRGKRYFFYQTNRIWLGWHQFGPGDTGYHKFQLSLRNDLNKA